MQDIVGMLHDTANNRFHPILFSWRPQPSGEPSDTAQRYKSRGHHTVGFDTREVALVGAAELIKHVDGVPCLEKDFPWDGEGVPAMVVYFKVDKDTATPLF